MNKFNVFGLVVIAGLLSGCVTSSEESMSCPQPRFTDKAPAEIYALKNPLNLTEGVIDMGEDLFMDTPEKLSCMKCHGRNGNGRGVMASMFDPPPRDFSCTKTIDGVPDGQLYWIIKNGSPGTSMPAFDHLSDKQTWQLVHYIRHLAAKGNL